MIHTRYQKITVLLIIQKRENMMYVHVKNQFANMSQKNTVQFVQLKKRNVMIVKIYLLNILSIVSLFYFINIKILINNF